MKTLQITIAGIALIGLTACSNINTVSRGVNPTQDLLVEEASTLVAPSYSVASVNVTVPQTLTVSESNTYKPNADIVWREDPIGDRYSQVATIVKDAISAGVSGLEGERSVILYVELARFHALTEKTRYSFGGTHDIRFNLTIADAESGEIIEPPRLIKIEFDAYGGGRALAAEARGETQKVRITAHLNQLIQQELATPREIPVL